MIEKLKKDFDEIMANNDIDTFGFVVDKKNNTFTLIEDVDSNIMKKNDNSISYTLSEITNSEDEYNKRISTLREAMDVDKTIIACAQTLLEKSSFDDSINKLLGILCEFYGGNYACLFERDYETSMTNVNYKYHKNDVNLINQKYTESFQISAEDEWTKYLREHDYAFLQTSNDIDSNLADSSYYKRFMESSRNNLLVVSLNDNDIILGGIEIDNITRNIQNVDLIKTISAFIVNNLHIKNTNLALQKNVTDLENKNSLNFTMLECVKTLVYDDNIEISMNKLLEIITTYFKADMTNIFYGNSSNLLIENQYSYMANKNNGSNKINLLPHADTIELFKKFDIGGVGYISSIREMSDILEENFPDSYELLLSNNINSLIFVPLIYQNQTVGFMGVENPKRNLNEAFLVKTMSNFVVNYINKNDLLIKLEKLSYTDNLTQLYNRNFYNNYLDEFKSNPQNSVGIIFADVNGLKKANDNFGHELGDKLIRWSANFFKNNVNGLNFRIGGDEFVCILENIFEEEFIKIVKCLKEKINSFGEVHISIGTAWSKDFPDIEKLISESDEDMYAEKKRYYQHLSNDERSVKNVLEEFKKSIQNLEFD